MIYQRHWQGKKNRNAVSVSLVCLEGQGSTEISNVGCLSLSGSGSLDAPGSTSLLDLFPAVRGSQTADVISYQSSGGEQ